MERLKKNLAENRNRLIEFNSEITEKEKNYRQNKLLKLIIK